MKKWYLVVFCLSMILASNVAAQNYETIGGEDGVDVLAAIDPHGPNNLVAAYVRFINNNSYEVNIKWTPVMTCQNGNTKKGYGADFSIKGGGSYEVTIWRSGACGERRITDFKVEMAVKKAGLY
jgi:hypothetical protein